jgi:hypothetical protein
MTRSKGLIASEKDEVGRSIVWRCRCRSDYTHGGGRCLDRISLCLGARELTYEKLWIRVRGGGGGERGLCIRG